MTELTDAERDLLLSYLKEDSGRGDPSALPFEGMNGEGSIVSESVCTISGLEAAVHLFEIAGCSAIAPDGIETGRRISSGQIVLELSGPVPGLLRVERVALNVLSRMSSIATNASELVEKLSSSGYACRLAGTRKTTPGFALFEKRALIDGGALPHRISLSDVCMIKDNHIASLRRSGSNLRTAIEAIRMERGPYLPIEVEAEDMDTALTALEAGADIVMMDNASEKEFGDAATTLRDRAYSLGRKVVIEASGGITAANMMDYARYADVVSMGSLTLPRSHSMFRMDMA